MTRRALGFVAAAALMAAAFAVPAGAVATKPGRPLAITVTTFRDGATIHWNPPASNGGSAITGYHITRFGFPYDDVGAGVHSLTLELFENGATYDFGIAAQNAAGIGARVDVKVIPRPNGYWMMEESSAVYAFGDVKVGPMHHARDTKYVHVEPSRSGQGLWIVNEFGDIGAFPSEFGTYGSDGIRSYGSLLRGTLLPGEKVVSLSRVNSYQGVCSCLTPQYESYWIFTSRGRVLPFGPEAKSYGDLANVALAKPIVGSVSTPTGKGYYMVAADGGVFSFGDAKFHGSTGNLKLNAPVMALVPNADNNGYWLVARDGGIFAFHAPFRGSMGGTRLNRPIVGMVRFGNGYLMAASDGGVFNFSNKKFYGSLAGHPLASPIVSIAASG